MLSSGECAGGNTRRAVPALPPDPAVRIAVLEALHCHFNDDIDKLDKATLEACGVARHVLDANQYESQISLAVLKGVIRSMSARPGQRRILLLSPGFVAPQMEYQYDALVEQALHAQVIISTLNGRGLYTVDTLGDISASPVIISGATGQKMGLAQATAQADEGILYQLAYGTGGTYFHNSNDFDQGLREIAAPPEYAYVLGFSPQNLKPDGRFHELKVTVKDRSKVTIQARKGYFAPKPSTHAAEEAKDEIEEALFSQKEVHDLPVELETEFVESSGNKFQLDVLAHIDVKRMRLRKDGERNIGSLTIASGVFDTNGKLVAGMQKDLDIHMTDDALNESESGITVKSSFNMARGSYLVRLVVRDTEGQFATESGSIEIP
jgi:hypothetical protein